MDTWICPISRCIAGGQRASCCAWLPMLWSVGHLTSFDEFVFANVVLILGAPLQPFSLPRPPLPFLVVVVERPKCYHDGRLRVISSPRLGTDCFSFPSSSPLGSLLLGRIALLSKGLHLLYQWLVCEGGGWGFDEWLCSSASSPTPKLTSTEFS